MNKNNPVIITGGAQRLGLASAIALNQQGFNVVITYRQERPLLDELKQQGIDCLQADFSDNQGIQNFIEAIKQRYSQIRAIIHNASTWSLHITDQVATIGSFKHMAYAASKAALENLTFSMARDLAPAVKVNAIAPALIKFNDWDDAQYREKALQKSLLGIEPGEACFSETVLFLLQNNYITGRVIPLDGGRHLKLP